MRIGLKCITPMLAAGAAAVAIGAAPTAAARRRRLARRRRARRRRLARRRLARRRLGRRLGRRRLGRWLGALVPSLGLVSGRYRARSRSCCRSLDHVDRASPAVVAMPNMHQTVSALRCARCGLQCVDNHLTAIDTKSVQAPSLSTVAVVDRSQIGYRLGGGTKWVSAVTSPVRWRANVEGQVHRQSKEVPLCELD